MWENLNCFLQALTTEEEIIFTHSSIEGGSSLSVYLILNHPQRAVPQYYGKFFGV